MTTDPNTRTNTNYDPVLALLADAMELIAAAREEYAEARRWEEVDARVERLLRESVSDEATFNHIRENGIGAISFEEGVR